MDLLIRHPWAAFVPAALFSALWLATRSKAVLAASAAWLCYGAYEYGMRLRWLCSGECNIRIDLFLIYPVLLALSAAGIWSVARTCRRPD